MDKAVMPGGMGNAGKKKAAALRTGTATKKKFKQLEYSIIRTR